MQKIENYRLKESITHIYIKDWQLRITYHLDDAYTSYWEKSDYYYNSWDEVVDTSKISDFFILDHRERDLTETLLEKWYFLIWETTDFLPDYVKKFFIEFHDYILSEQPKAIKRTSSGKILIYVKLWLLPPQNNLLKKYSTHVREILSKF